MFDVMVDSNRIPIYISIFSGQCLMIEQIPVAGLSVLTDRRRSQVHQSRLVKIMCACEMDI